MNTASVDNQFTNYKAALRFFFYHQFELKFGDSLGDIAHNISPE